MFVTARRVGEELLFDVPGVGLVRILIRDIIRDNKVVLAIDAPRSVPIHRVELWKKFVEGGGSKDE